MVTGRGREKVVNTRGSVDGEGQDRGQTVGVLHKSNQIDVQNWLTCQQGERGTDRSNDRVSFCDSSTDRVRVRIRIRITDGSLDRQKDTSAGRSVDIQGGDGGVGVFLWLKAIPTKRFSATNSWSEDLPLTQEDRRCPFLLQPYRHDTDVKPP
jgi:hypothetical protein